VDRATAGRLLFPERDLLHTDFKRSGLYRSNRTPPRSGGLVDPKPSSDQSRLPALSFRCEAYPPKIHPLLAPQHCSRNHAGSPVRRLSPGHRRRVLSRGKSSGAELRRKRDLRSAFVRFCLAVPELTRGTDIKLNARICLRRHRRRAVIIYRTISRRPDPAWQNRQAIIFRLAALLSH
jgi:hypothetical protein